MKEYKEKQIIKHALQHYIQRPEATKKDIDTEKRLLAKITQEVESLKDQYSIKSTNAIDGGISTQQAEEAFAKIGNAMIRRQEA